MPCLIANLPSQEVWVRKEYLTDHKSGHGEYVKGVWVSVKSMPGRAFYFETYLPEYADLCTINCLSVPSYRPQKRRNLILRYITYNSGIVWTTESQ